MTDIYDKLAERIGGFHALSIFSQSAITKTADFLRKKFGPLEDKVGDYIVLMGTCEYVDDEPWVCAKGDCNYCDMIREFQTYIGHPVKE